MRRLALALSVTFLPALVQASPQEVTPSPKRAIELKEFLRTEKPEFDRREALRRSTLEELDRINAEANEIRSRSLLLKSQRQEIEMAHANLSVDVDRLRSAAALENQRLRYGLRIAYRVRRHGVLPFLLRGQKLSLSTAKLRWLFRMVRIQGKIAGQLADRTARLSESQQKLAAVSSAMENVLSELKQEEKKLESYLSQKRKLVASLAKKQGQYQSAQKEYRKIAQHVSSLFDQFEAIREGGEEERLPGRGSLPLPVPTGTLVSQFGKSVHKSFGTVTVRKGIEIEAEINTPVRAILPGIVEYEGWVKGLGNVMILHHGNGFYTLNAHLHKALVSKGTHVAQGDPIGLVGDTGSNLKPSLYFEIREQGKAVNPLSYFSPQALASLQ